MIIYPCYGVYTMNQLTRVQVYLDPNNLSIIDKVASGIKINRSQIIRDAVEAATDKYSETLKLLKKKKKPNLALWLSMAGIEKSKTGRVGLNVDEIYNED